MYLLNRLKRIVRIIIFLLLFAIIGGVILSIIFPLSYRDEINKYSETYDIDPFLVAAIIKVESSFNKEAVSSRDARGLMQIGPTTGRWAAEVLEIEDYTEDSLFDPKINIKFGTWYIRQLKREFGGDLNLVLAAYNAGSGNVSNWLKDERNSEDGQNLTNIPFEETDNYLRKVKLNYRSYSLIYKRLMYMDSGESSLYFDIVLLIRKNLSKIYDYII